MIKKLLFLLSFVVLIGCQSIPQDTTPAPISHNKMTLELQSCNKQEVGLLGCFFDDSQTGQLIVPLWNKGEYQIQSDRCRFFENKKFEKTTKLTIDYKKLLAERPEEEGSCLFNIKVFIDKFDNGFEGFFLLSKGDMKLISFDFEKESYLGYAGLQFKEGMDIQSSFDFKAETPGTLIWEGCLHDGELKYEKNPKLPFKDVVSGILIPKDSCVLTVGLIPDDESKPVEYGKVHINVYEKTIVSLPDPILEYDKEKLTVRADKLVAGITIGDELSIEKGNGNKKFSAKVPKDKEVIVRLFTSNGRFMLLKVKNGVVVWVK